MRRKNRYGQGTIAPCFFCREPATQINDVGLETCKKCKDKIEVKCPMHGIVMDRADGPYGVFFSCYKCPGNGNWSLAKIMKWNR